VDNYNTVLVNDLSSQPWNSNVAYNNSWVGVGGALFPLFAQASYITNLDDIKISLSASNVAIGDVHISDPNGLNADVVSIDPTGSQGVGGGGALRVLSQDLESSIDDVTIGDKNGINFARINAANSALNVFTTNGISAVSITNPVTSVNVKSLVTNWDVLSAAINNSTYTTLPSNPANEITILNNTGGTMYIKNASKTIGLPIDNNTSADLKLVGNTNEVAIKASSDNKTVFATFISYN
jgi:hypothetical protein